MATACLHPGAEASQAVTDCFSLLLLSSDTYPPTRVDLTALFGSELGSRGHRIDLILQSESPCRRSYETHWPGGRIWVARTDTGSSLLRRIRKHLLGLRADAGLFRHLRSGNYDLLIVKDKFLSGVLGLIGARLFQRGFVYWLSYPFPELYLERARDGTARYPLLYWIRGMTFRLLLYRLLLPRADHVFVQSDQMLRDVAAHGIAPARMTAVPMGIEPRAFAPAPLDGVALGNEAPRIVYIGSLSRVRRPEFLLRVLLKVRAARPGARLILVGRGDDPADEAFLYEEARRLQLPIGTAVVLTGQLPRAEALRHVREAQVCVSPIRRSLSLNAGSPTKLIEYMAMARPVVANDQPEQRLLIEQSGAGYCVAYDEQPFAEAILRILANPDGAAEMGRRGREYVLRHRAYDVIASGVERRMLQIAAPYRERRERRRT
jgi:glycosyltransferase involved in cell wall biosynthesis